jgi:ribosomal protein S18 acetylase RimI-like enzyme
LTGLELARGLSAAQLAAIADLERRTVAADGGRLKLEWPTLHDRPTGQVQDVLWWDGTGRLRGFTGVYAFAAGQAELAGMVDPAARRRGIGSALLGAALAICTERGFAARLLVVPRTGAGGAAFASRHGGTLEHSEHALVLDEGSDAEPDGAPAAAREAAITLRPAGPADVPTVAELLTSLGTGAADVTARLRADLERTFVAELGGEIVATMRLSRRADEGAVHGFVVSEALRGRGIGRRALRLGCQRLRADGARRIGLEVAVDNEHALGLYTALGFVPVITEDYYAMPAVAPPR